MGPYEKLKLEQQIRATVAQDDRLRQAVCDVIGDGPAEALADSYGISATVISKWRRGEGTPTLRMARKILEAARRMAA